MSSRVKTKNEWNSIDRRGFLECMRWAGGGLLWSMVGGIGRSHTLESGVGDAHPDLSFVQISDSHMGFNKPANTDVAGTFKLAIDKINASPSTPSFLIHTGDISHLSKAAEFDQVQQMLKSCKVSQHYFVPGEHDVLENDGKDYLDRFGKGALGGGWYSFDVRGVHFVALVNVMNLKSGGLGSLGREQLEWLEQDLKGKTSNTPIVVFAHVPLWTVYQEWGWGTEDGMQALSYLRRFGSVSILNGHIHQTTQKIEGNMLFHTATSTAFPQPRPGTAPSPGPMKVPADQLKGLLGLTQVAYVQGRDQLAVVDQSLASEEPDPKPTSEVTIDNFSFSPTPATVSPGAEVTWTNRDDIPHTVVSTARKFKSSVLDTGNQFSFKFSEPGEYPYFCSVHPKMTGTVIVKG